MITHGPRTHILLTLGSLAIVFLLATQCTSEESKATPIPVPDPIQVVELEAIVLDGRTVLRFYDRESRVLCYKDVGYHNLSCVYIGHPTGYPELDQVTGDQP